MIIVSTCFQSINELRWIKRIISRVSTTTYPHYMAAGESINYIQVTAEISLKINPLKVSSRPLC